MKYLIDTQAFIWALISPEKLSAPVRPIMQGNTICISVTSLLEITIKQKVGKLPELPVTTDELVDRLKKDGFELLPLTVQHITYYAALPLYADHREPRSVATV